MDFLKPKQPSPQKRPLSPPPLLHHAFNSLRTHLISTLNNICIPNPQLSVPNPFASIPSPFAFLSSSSSHQLSSIPNNPFASLSFSGDSILPISDNNNNNIALSKSEIKKRMPGVPVYKVSNYSQDALVSTVESDSQDKENQLYFFNKKDAEDYFDNAFRGFPGLASDYQIFDVPLAEVVDCEGVSPQIRLVPELSQVKNAIQERKKDVAVRRKYFPWFRHETFSGVPVFQSDYMTIDDYGEDPPNCSEPSEFRLAYFRKEDLEKALAINKCPTDNIQVAALEDMIHEMKDCSSSKSNNVIFVAPGTTSWTWFGRI